MPYATDAAGSLRVRPDPGEFDRTDRILLGACVAIWLTALGAAVAATVALVDLGTADQESGESGTPWLLYVVIAVSAAVIIGAVPLLIRARREATSGAAEPPARPASPQGPGRQESARGDAAQTEKLRISGATTVGRINAGPGYAAAVTPSTALPAPLVAAIDQVWLRCAVLIACAVGIAMVAIGVATYLMAIEGDAAAWVLFVLSGLVTLAMPAIPWFYLRELRALLEDQSA